MNEDERAAFIARLKDHKLDFIKSDSDSNFLEGTIEVKDRGSKGVSILLPDEGDFVAIFSKLVSPALTMSGRTVKPEDLSAAVLSALLRNTNNLFCMVKFFGTKLGFYATFVFLNAKTTDEDELAYRVKTCAGAALELEAELSKRVPPAAANTG
jgi:hypothetical protein